MAASPARSLTIAEEAREWLEEGQTVSERRPEESSIWLVGRGNTATRMNEARAREPSERTETSPPIVESMCPPDYGQRQPPC